jgi:hypothetical protein
MKWVRVDMILMKRKMDLTVTLRMKVMITILNKMSSMRRHLKKTFNMISILTILKMNFDYI